jgi:hypothetical protein
MRAFGADLADARLRDFAAPILTLGINGLEASASGTGSDGNRVTPRTSAFRESTRPVLAPLGWRPAFAFAQKRS